jgi:3-keto-5-aminohexanoate cleavage enzyme
MHRPPSLWEAAKREMDSYQFIAAPELQPRWEVPQAMAIGVAVATRFSEAGHLGSTSHGQATSLEDYVDAASAVIDAGATSIHIDFSWVTDKQGRRLDQDIPPVEAYGAVLEPLRKRFGHSFTADLNVLNGATFDLCMSPAVEGLAEIAPCAPGHPEEFMIPAVRTLEEYGVKPQLAIHNTGEIELAKRKLIDTGILKPPFYFTVLIGLPFNVGRTLLSGTSLTNFQDTAQQLFVIVDQIKRIDPSSIIMVCAAGRATLYLTTLATMMGLDIRVGTEDTPWKYPNADERLTDNLQMFNMAKDIAALHGRRPATANEFRKSLGLAQR